MFSALCFASAAFCMGYFLLCGLADSFSLPSLWIWPAGGAVLSIIGAAALFARRHKLYKAARAAAIALAALITPLMCFFIFTQINIASRQNDAGPPGLDCIIVLGAGVRDGEPTPYLRSRIETAFRYLEANPDTLVVATGGLEEGETMSEADCVANALIELGISRERIAIERRALNTFENISFSLELLPEGCERVGVVTTDYHLYRALVCARSQDAGREFCGLAAPFSYPTELHLRVRESAALLTYLLEGKIAPDALAA